MRLIKIGLANVDPTVGAFASNTAKIISCAREMAEARCTVGVFPECVISGYPAEDIVQWSGFIRGQWRALEKFVRATQAWSFPTVFVLGLAVEHGGHPYNAAAVVSAGKIIGLVPKEKLPTYSVFNERRTFSAGVPGLNAEICGIPFGDFIFDSAFGTLAVEVCEDIWSPDGPMKRRAYGGAELIVNISASPWRAGVVATRREMISTRAADNCAAVVYVNQVGGNDGLVFDGGGFVNQGGRMMLELSRWREGVEMVVVDLDRTSRQRRENTTWRMDCEQFHRGHTPLPRLARTAGPSPNQAEYCYPIPDGGNFFLPPDEVPQSPRREYLHDLIEAMITGLKGYFEKSAGVFARIAVALSGGRDSALVLIVSWLYAKRRFAHLKGIGERAQAMHEFIQCFSLPTFFNSPATRRVAQTLCEFLGVSFKEVSIQEAFEREREAAQEMFGAGRALTETTLQNIQARIRASRMWNWANSAKALWVQTGNMSEKAVGYTTIGGDLEGAYALIGNLPKTVVEELLRHLRAEYHISPLDEVLRSPASAELTEGQTDEDDLMPFAVLDACYYLFAGEKLMPVEVYRVLRQMFTDDDLRKMRADYQTGMLKAWVKEFVLLFRAAIYKWVQAPLAVHLGSLDLDRERALQLPVVQSPEWLALEELDQFPD